MIRDIGPFDDIYASNQEELERLSANDQIKELLIERIKNDLQNPFEYCDISKGSAGSCIFCCLVCGASHFRDWPMGQGNPSWCVDCARSGRSKEPDGRVVPVLERKLEDWKSLWDIFDERKRHISGGVQHGNER